jgi:hypothetical protein
LCSRLSKRFFEEVSETLVLIMRSLTTSTPFAGLDAPGLFRLAGDSERITELVRAFNTAPLYGDHLDLGKEPIHNLTGELHRQIAIRCPGGRNLIFSHDDRILGVLKHFLRDMPEPLLSPPVWPIFIKACIETDDSTTTATRIQCARIIFQLLPRRHLSMLVYLFSFFSHVSARENKLTADSCGIIFGFSLFGLRGDHQHRVKGVLGVSKRRSRLSGVGVGVNGKEVNPAAAANAAANAEEGVNGEAGEGEEDQGTISLRVLQLSKQALAFVIHNWDQICPDLYDPGEHFSAASSPEAGGAGGARGAGEGGARRAADLLDELIKSRVLFGEEVGAIASGSGSGQKKQPNGTALEHLESAAASLTSAQKSCQSESSPSSPELVLQESRASEHVPVLEVPKKPTPQSFRATIEESAGPSIDRE